MVIMVVTLLEAYHLQPFILWSTADITFLGGLGDEMLMNR